MTSSIARLAIAIVVFLTVNPGLAAALAPKPLDGVQIEALETYLNPRSQQIDFGLGVWPLAPYYNGFSLDVGYTHFFNKTWSWEVLHGDYLYTVDKGLTSELAQNYGVNPISIERLQMLLSTNVGYVLAYGKFIFSKEYIHYFRSTLLAGPAFIATNKQSTVAIGAGVRLETFVNTDFSWKLELRDAYGFGNIGNNLAFIFGTTYGF